MNKFPQLVQLSEYVPVLNCNPLKSVSLYNSLASHSSWFMAIFALHSHLVSSTRATSSLPSSVRADSRYYRDTGKLLLKCASQPSSSLLIRGTITISTSNPQPEPPPPLLLPTYNSQLVAGCGQPYFLLPDETHMARKAKYKKVNKSRGIWG